MDEYYQYHIAEIENKPCCIEKQVEALMFSPKVEEMRGQMAIDGIYSAKDIEVLCRLEAAYIEECGRSECGADELSEYYGQQIEAITLKYQEIGQEKEEDELEW